MCQTKEGCGARTHLGGGGEGESGLVTRRMSPTTLSKRVRCQGLPKGGVRLQSMFGDGGEGGTLGTYPTRRCRCLIPPYLSLGEEGERSK